MTWRHWHGCWGRIAIGHHARRHCSTAHLGDSQRSIANADRLQTQSQMHVADVLHTFQHCVRNNNRRRSKGASQRFDETIDACMVEQHLTLQWRYYTRNRRYGREAVYLGITPSGVTHEHVMGGACSGHVSSVCVACARQMRGHGHLGRRREPQSTVHRDAAETALAYGRRDAWAVGGLTLSRRRPPYSCSLYSSIGPAT